MGTIARRKSKLMSKKHSKPTKGSVVERNVYICDDHYKKLVDLSFVLKTRNMGAVIDHILTEFLTEDKMKEMLNEHIDSIKEMLKLRFTENKKIVPLSTPPLKSTSRRFFRISSQNAQKLDELSYISNKPAYILLNEVISDYLKKSPVEI